DAIQTAGAFPTTVEHVDFLAADAHKWMLGPCAAGILYVRKSLQEQLRPPVYGWNNLLCPNFVTMEDFIYRPGAQRYEVGTHNWIGMVGLAAALELLLEVGIDNIAAELARKRAWLVPALQARGYSVLHATVPPANAGGITTFSKPGADMTALHQRLADADIATALRVDRAGNHYIRLSPHFYNTDAELQRLLEVL
ncbi:MAG TPA: aminotransferase class V-fold PLP-dependent enzyme, partial [Verrucomicrobiae bacterium]|nr:aminotransferase class V-fold PLP-dependent enzyme [Verrucomicrobiae bacterium]